MSLFFTVWGKPSVSPLMRGLLDAKEANAEQGVADYMNKLTTEQQIEVLGELMNLEEEAEFSRQYIEQLSTAFSRS